MTHKNTSGLRLGGASATHVAVLSLLAVLGLGILSGTYAFADHTINPYDHPHLDYAYVPPILNAKTNELTLVFNTPVYPLFSPDKVEYDGMNLLNATARSDDGVTFVISLTDAQVAKILSNPSTKIDILEGAVEDTNNLDNKRTMYILEIVGSATGQGTLDNTAPVITLVGDKTITVRTGTDYNDAGATCTDDTDGAVRTLVSNPVDVTSEGKYTVTYRCIDSAGNKADRETRIVTVSNNAVVGSTSNGPAIASAQAPLAVQSLSATAIGSDYVTIEWPANSDVDSYTVFVIVGDAGILYSARTVKTSYNVTGLSSETGYSILVVGIPYAPVKGSPLDIQTSFSSPDPVVAKLDSVAPVITMNGTQSVEMMQGSAYDDNGAACKDHLGISLPIGVNGTVNSNIPGNYTFTFTCKDNDGIFAEPVSRTVIVMPASDADGDVEEIPDTTAPVITLSGQQNVEMTVGDSYTDAGATCTDDRDGSIAPVASSNVDASAPGTYKVTYSCTDAAGNAATDATRTIVVSLPADTTAPVITLNGQQNVEMTVGDSYTDAGATCTDDRDGLLSVTVDATSVDTQTAGNYTITYTCTDTTGNQQTSSRYVIVQEPVVQPLSVAKSQSSYVVDPDVIRTVQGYASETKWGNEHQERWNRVLAAFGVLTHSNPMNSTEAQVYADYGWNRWNPIVGILVELETSIADGSGETSEPPRDMTRPIITLNGTMTVTISAGDLHNDVGATCIDDVDGTLPVSDNSSSVDTQTVGNYIITYTCTDAVGNNALPVSRIVVVTAPIATIDPALIDDVRSYAAEVKYGAEHVDRWYRVLAAFDAIKPMNASEAYTLSKTYLSDRWDPVVIELQNPGVSQSVITDVKSYSAETQYGTAHVDRWYRVLAAFDAIEPITLAEAKLFATMYIADRWDPVVIALETIQ